MSIKIIRQCLDEDTGGMQLYQFQRGTLLDVIREVDEMISSLAALKAGKAEVEKRIAELETLLVDRATPGEIDVWFRSGDRQAEIDESGETTTQCSYAEDSLERHWWTRGYAYKVRIFRALSAEARAEAAERCAHNQKTLADGRRELLRQSQAQLASAEADAARKGEQIKAVQSIIDSLDNQSNLSGMAGMSDEISAAMDEADRIANLLRSALQPAGEEGK